MIKYLELTAPEESQFRQAKITAVLVNEGDEVAVGDPLFKVLSGSNEIDLPSRLAGKIIELIVEEGEKISSMTPLVLLETEVEKSSASKPINSDDNPQTPPPTELSPSRTATTPPTLAATKLSKRSSQREKGEPIEAGDHKEKKAEKSKQAKAKKSIKKDDQQQSLNLDDKDTTELVDSDPSNLQAVSSQPKQPTASRQMSDNKIAVPDIGIDSAKVIEILVNVGDSIAVDDSLVTLESDKASMDVPSTFDGVVESIEVSIDQEVSEGDILITLAVTEDTKTSNATGAELAIATESQSLESKEEKSRKELAPTPDANNNSAAQGAAMVEVTIPDIGGDSAKIIEIFITQGQSVEVEDPLVTLESDKASMDVPSTVSGVIESIEVQLDQEVSEGTLIAKISSSAAVENAAAESAAKQAVTKEEPASQTSRDNEQVSKPDRPSAAETTDTPPPQSEKKSVTKSHASPSVRRFARELGAELSTISGTGRKSRITKDDVKKFVKGLLSTKSAPVAGGESAGIPAVPAVDFTKFGEIDIQPLNKIKRLTAANLHRSWLNVPHVTHSDESNISDLESFRKQLNAEYVKQGKEIKLSPLAFIVKAVVNALQAYPQFNSSLEPGGQNLIYKKYIHIGIAVETPNGLVVPVLRNADKKSVAEIASEMSELAAKARDKKLTPADMSGSCFTISSLGGIGGTGFTPIVNAPEVAILGVSRSKMQPVWNGSDFEPGMILPLSLSYDHRVIDGAEAARFTRQIAAVLEDVRRLAV